MPCSPFAVASGKGKNKPAVADCTAGDMDAVIDMNIMLAQGAVEAFSSSADGMFTKGKNYYWVDYAACDDEFNADCQEPLVGSPRAHFEWDLDAAIGKNDANVYGTFRKQRGVTVLQQTEHQRVILNDPSFRPVYNGMLETIVGDAYIVDGAIAYLNSMEAALTPLLEADPNSKISDAAGHFDALRGWLTDRAAVVRDQVCNDPGYVCAP